MEKIQLSELIEFDDKPVMKRLADVSEVQMNLVCLGPGQMLPPHNANSNVRILVLQGELSVELCGKPQTLGEKEIIEAEFDTPMQIGNKSDSNTAFLVIKTPNPSEWRWGG